MYSIQLPADSTISHRTPENWVIDRFRLVAFSPFCVRPLRGYLFIVLDFCGLGNAPSTLPFDMEVPNGNPPDVPWFESVTGLLLKYELLTIICVPAGQSLVSFGDSIADREGLLSNATLDSPASVGCLSVVISLVVSRPGVSLEEPAENLITALNLDDPLVFLTIVETFLRS